MEILFKEIDIYRLMTHSKKIKSEKLPRMKMRESKRDYFYSGFLMLKSLVGISNKAMGHLRVLIKGLGCLPLKCKVRYLRMVLFLLGVLSVRRTMEVIA